MWLTLLACHPVAALHGVAPQASPDIPAFEAVNQEGQPRSRDDLLGHPTVVWFFPAAGTPG